VNGSPSDPFCQEAQLFARLDMEHTSMEEEEQLRLIETLRPNADFFAYYRGNI
jgi:hypothetical protein